uniref:Uncharacterized protein n=1 Tax=Sus scrofa TaxID=9823 RepID=A0A8D1ULL4_PIG
MSALRWPQPSQEVGALRGPPQGAWSDYLEEPGPPRNACSHPVWSADEEPKDGDSSVSSGRLSGSSGGHESGTFPRGPWKERTPQVLGPSRRPRESSPRLEQLRGKIRAQARRQASCASLGTSTPSSASHLYKTPTPAARRKSRKPAKPPPALAFPGSGIQSESESGVEDKATPGQGREPSRVSRRQPSVPWENPKSRKSRSCKSEKAPKPPPPRRTAKDTGRVGPLGAGRAWGQEVVVQAEDTGMWRVSGVGMAGTALVVPRKGRQGPDGTRGTGGQTAFSSLDELWPFRWLRRQEVWLMDECPEAWFGTLTPGRDSCLP